MSERPGGKDALQCLQRHVASLLPACKSAVRATMPKPKPVVTAPPPKTAHPTANAAPPPARKAAKAPPPPHKAAKAPPPPKAAHKRVTATKKAAAPAAPLAIAPPPSKQPDPAVVMAKAARVPLRRRMAVFRACNPEQGGGLPLGAGGRRPHHRLPGDACRRIVTVLPARGGKSDAVEAPQPTQLALRAGPAAGCAPAGQTAGANSRDTS
jgi:hypothetical protein